MKIYLVMGEYEYELQVILSAFKSEERAKKELSKILESIEYRNKKDFWYDDYYISELENIDMND